MTPPWVSTAARSRDTTPRLRPGPCAASRRRRTAPADRERADGPGEEEPRPRNDQRQHEREQVQQQDARPDREAVPDLNREGRAACRRQGGIEPAFHGGGDPLYEQRPDDRRDRKEQPEGQQRGADAAEQSRGPGPPSVQREQMVDRPRGDGQQSEEAHGRPGEAAPDHALENGVVELRDGATSGARRMFMRGLLSRGRLPGGLRRC